MNTKIKFCHVRRKLRINYQFVYCKQLLNLLKTVFTNFEIQSANYLQIASQINEYVKLMAPCMSDTNQ